MKKFLKAATISLLLLTLIVSSEDEHLLSEAPCDFKRMEAFYLARLEIANITISYSFEQLSHPYHLGQTRQIAPHQYHIKLAKHLEPSELRITLAHELVHVRQFEQGEIKKDEFQKDYLMRSHEDEAFRLSLPMARDFYIDHNCANQNKK